MTEARIEFFKFQGLGNDFVLLDMRDGSIEDPAGLSRAVCRRRFGIGADGLILVFPHPDCAARMEIYNADGSRAQMCGNGLRCVARHVRDSWGESQSSFRIMTDAGSREISFLASGVAATLGEPIFSPALIPARLADEGVLHSNLGIAGLPPAACLSLGNPHCVFFVKNVEAFPVAEIGPVVENLPAFPERINVEFAELVAPGRLRCRVWERGVGETLACGTGAASAAIVATLRGLVPGEAVVELPGGQLSVSWKDRKAVSIAGKAEEVFRGSIAIPASSLREPAPVESFSPHAA